MGRNILTISVAEADRSNPTRHRYESPLATIRSFEAAIDMSYQRRVSDQRRESRMLGPFAEPKREEKELTRRAGSPDMQARQSSYFSGKHKYIRGCVRFALMGELGVSAAL